MSDEKTNKWLRQQIKQSLGQAKLHSVCEPDNALYISIHREHYNSDPYYRYEQAKYASQVSLQYIKQGTEGGTVRVEVNNRGGQSQNKKHAGQAT